MCTFMNMLCCSAAYLVISVIVKKISIMNFIHRKTVEVQYNKEQYNSKQQYTKKDKHRKAAGYV